MNFSELDFEALEDIPPLRRHYDVPRISITEKGMVSMKEEMCSILTSNSTWKQRGSPCLPFTRWSGARSGGPGSAAVRTCPNPRPSLRWISPRKSEDLRRGGADET